MSDRKADAPTSAGGKQYHLHTDAHDLAPHCLLVGSPERAELIAGTDPIKDAEELVSRFFGPGAIKVGDHRGLRSFTGEFQGVPMSVVTTGMGSASTGIVLPEAVRSGAERFIRVGSCSTLQREPNVGESAIASGAVRLDGASTNWAPIEYPAFADHRVIAALIEAAETLSLPHHVGIEATTTCFNEGQARPDDMGYIPPRLQMLHDELTQRGVLLYSMESATIYVWCMTHGGYWAGSVNAIYGNRQTNTFEVTGDEEAALIGLNAMKLLHDRFPLAA